MPKRKAADEAASQSPKKAKSDLSEPLPTLAEAIERDVDLLWPEYEVRVAQEEEDPSENYLNDLRSRSSAAQSRNEAIPPMELRFSPFFHSLKTNYATLTRELKKIHIQGKGDYERPLLTLGSAGIFDRDHTQEVRREDKLKTLAGMCSYFWNHSIPDSVINRLLTQDQDRELWVETFNAQSRTYEIYILKTITMALESLSAMYGFEFLTSLSDAEFRQLVTAIFDLDPRTHAMAMWAKHHAGVDIMGIYRDVGITAEQTKRDAFRASIRYRFVTCCLVTWKYCMNIDPRSAAIAKRKASELWRDMAADDRHLSIVTPLGCAESVPVHDTLHSNQNKSLFELTLSRKH